CARRPSRCRHRHRAPGGTAARHRIARRPGFDPGQGGSIVGVGVRTDADARLLHRADAGPATGPRAAGCDRRVDARALRRLGLPPRPGRAGHSRLGAPARRRLRLPRDDRAALAPTCDVRQAGRSRAPRRTPPPPPPARTSGHARAPRFVGRTPDDGHNGPSYDAPRAMQRSTRMKTVTDLTADVEARAERTTSQMFVELLAARDFERLAGTLASDAH